MLNVIVFNLMSRTNETRHIEWHETCKCKSRLDASICNNKQLWNDDKCRCKCKELFYNGAYDRGLVLNPSSFQCECDKSCDVSQYLDYEKSKCRKKLVDKLVKECTENIEETRLPEVTSAKDENKHKCSSCTLYIILFSINFTISVGIGTYFACSHWYLKKDVTGVTFGTRNQTI